MNMYEFKPIINVHIIQEYWLLKTSSHLEKLEENSKRNGLKKFRKLRKNNSNSYFTCLTRFDSHDEFFDFETFY